jgi:hypothetical protein
MEKAIRIYFKQKYNITLDHSSITSIQLEVEGLVEHRVNAMYEQLLPNSASIRKADLIFIATHSQGTPASVMLIDKLISEDMINPTRQRIGLLAMAGISHGPFPPLKSNLVLKYVEQDAARQLFDFNDPESPISKLFSRCMVNVLESGVKITAIGSWYDQVVPVSIRSLIISAVL